MTEQTPADESGVPAITKALLAVHQHIGPEHQALAKEEQETTAKERLGTVRRMKQNLVEVNLQLFNALELLATVHGMRALGLHAQPSQDDAGKDYRVLPIVGNPEEKLYEAAEQIGFALRALVKLYEPTQKYPGLAVARCPQQMSQVLRSFRQAVTAVCAELARHELADEAADLGPWSDVLEQLEARVCRVVPAQATTGLTADDVTAAILSDPEIARAAATALERANA